MDDLGIRIDETPASFVGTLVEVRAAAPGGGGVFRFEVEEWVKGGPAGHVDVHSWIGDGANCGLGTDIGQELGILLYPDGEKLTSNICSITSPEMLLAAGKNHSPGPGAVPPLTIEEPGVLPGSLLARVVFLTLAGVAVIGAGAMILTRGRRPESTG